jgi:hypothetical protein
MLTILEGCQTVASGVRPPARRRIASQERRTNKCVPDAPPGIAYVVDAYEAYGACSDRLRMAGEGLLPGQGREIFRCRQVYVSQGDLV